MLAFDDFQWKEVITFGIALLGAGLGIMNAWYAFNQRQVRLRVKPAHMITAPEGALFFGIEIVNLSGFAVTVTDVGFTYSWRGIKAGRQSIIQPILRDGKPWPRRLESRESVSTLFNPRELLVHSKRIRKAYASTACGEVAYGTSPALKQLRNQIGRIDVPD